MKAPKFYVRINVPGAKIAVAAVERIEEQEGRAAS